MIIKHLVISYPAHQVKISKSKSKIAQFLLKYISVSLSVKVWMRLFKKYFIIKSYAIYNQVDPSISPGLLTISV